MPITDLTGYTWTSNTGSISAYNFPYYRDSPISINFTYNGQNYSLMFRFSDCLCFGTSTSNYVEVYDGDINEWIATPPLVVEFTGGTGATDSDFISWLEENGTLTAPQSTLIPPSIGNKDIVGAFVGNKQVKSMWLGNTKIYEGGAIEYTQESDILTINNAPYSLSGDILTIGE